MMKRAISFIIVFICLALAGHLSAFADNELPAPTNIGWKDGSTATATWDAVEGANYYRVHVYVYYDGKEIGNTITGTADTSLDLQAEINQIVQDNFEITQITYTVTPGLNEFGIIQFGYQSSLSSFLRQHRIIRKTRTELSV